MFSSYKHLLKDIVKHSAIWYRFFFCQKEFTTAFQVTNKEFKKNQGDKKILKIPVLQFKKRRKIITATVKKLSQQIHVVNVGHMAVKDCDLK